MKPEIFICLAIVLSFAACDRSTPKEEDEEYVRLNDIYHLKKVEFYLSEHDGLSVTEEEGVRRTIYNTAPVEQIFSFKDEDMFSSVFYFEGNQPYTLLIDTARKIRVPSLLENDVLYMGQDEVWCFRDSEPEVRLTGEYKKYTWNIAPMCLTIVDYTVKKSTITVSFDACFVGENTHSEVIIRGKWEGRETEYINYEFVTDEID